MPPTSTRVSPTPSRSWLRTAPPSASRGRCRRSRRRMHARTGSASCSSRVPAGRRAPTRELGSVAETSPPRSVTVYCVGDCRSARTHAWPTETISTGTSTAGVASARALSAPERGPRISTSPGPSSARATKRRSCWRRDLRSCPSTVRTSDRRRSSSCRTITTTGRTMRRERSPSRGFSSSSPAPRSSSTTRSFYPRRTGLSACPGRRRATEGTSPRASARYATETWPKSCSTTFAAP